MTGNQLIDTFFGGLGAAMFLAAGSRSGWPSSCGPSDPGPVTPVTDAELSVLVGFLTSGVLLGTLGGWIDQLLTFIRKG